MYDSTGTYRIATVCLGNICRSPIAESVLAQRIREAGLGSRVRVESAGTAGWHEGSDADHRARRELATSGYPLNHSARQFNPAWFTELDLVLGMDYQNLLDLRELTTDPDAHERIKMFRSFDLALMHLPEDDPELNVPDPYYGTQEDFKAVVAMAEEASAGIIDHVRLALG